MLIMVRHQSQACVYAEPFFFFLHSANCYVIVELMYACIQSVITKYKTHITSTKEQI